MRGGRTGRKLFGAVFKLSSDRLVYLEFRNRKDIFRGGEKSVSVAHDKGIACWAMDYDTLLSMRNQQIELVGVYVRDEGDIYITRRENFFDSTKATVKNYESRGGTLQEYLPLRHFVKIGDHAVA